MSRYGAYGLVPRLRARTVDSLVTLLYEHSRHGSNTLRFGMAALPCRAVNGADPDSGQSRNSIENLANTRVSGRLVTVNKHSR